MAELAPQGITSDGAAINPVTPSGTLMGDDTVKPVGDRSALYVRNDTAGVINVTVKTPQIIHGQEVPDIPVAVPVSDFRMVKMARDLAESDGLIKIQTDTTASVGWAHVVN